MADTGVKAEGRAAGKLVPLIFPIFRDWHQAMNASRSSREQADRRRHSVRETVSRTGVSQEGWFSISG